jgi:hypothetical protein
MKTATFAKNAKGRAKVPAIRSNVPKYYQIWTDLQIGDFTVPVQTRVCIDPTTWTTWIDDGSVETLAVYIPSSGGEPRWMNRRETDILCSQMVISANHYGRLVDPEDIEPIVEERVETVYQVDWRATAIWNLCLFPAAGIMTVMLLGFFMKLFGA